MKRFALFLISFLVLSCSACSTQNSNHFAHAGYKKVFSRRIVTASYYVRKGHELIYGQIWRPESAKRLPVAVLSHGLNGNASDLAPYARDLARRGFLVYALDYPGGSNRNLSSGRTSRQMSLLTEQGDLLAVIKALRRLPQAGKGKDLLLGASQGGIVSSLLAAKHPELVKSLILLYPAFNIPDFAQALFHYYHRLPNRISLMGMSLGRAYFKPLRSASIKRKETRFSGPVLIINGDNDYIVPDGYSLDAARRFHDARLDIIAGAGHDFRGRYLHQASKDINHFLQ